MLSLETNSRLTSLLSLQTKTALMDGGSMGLWHAVQYYDANKLKDELSYEAWPAVSHFATPAFHSELLNLNF